MLRHVTQELPFQLRRIVYLDRPYAPVREGSMDGFP